MSDGKIPAGYYKGRGVEGSEQYGRTNAGDVQIALDLDVPSLNRKFTTFLYFTEAAAPYAIERLRACGWIGMDLSDLRGIGSAEVDVQIKYETYKGAERMKVDIATGGGRIVLEKPLDEKEKREFAARMKGLLAGAAPPPRRSTTPSPTASNAGRSAPEPDYDPNAGFSGDSDEIPF